ncbi:10 kDa heat shock protein, mitochondrial-like [Physella acuta]|uniref:10 kDa heat shock protein, mitochondrial-like n=1 Tax=Physella acuta TaxID=109671 RepID=UPI0027DE536B|nr:10 kDa heat shock protein, mitochondrial-like [Physella acuta]
MAQAFKRFIPMFDWVLVKRFLPEVKTKVGIKLPEKSQGKVVEATVVATGTGARKDNGTVVPPSVKVEDKVLLPEYGGTTVVLEEKEYYLFRDSDLLGKF